jgi:ribonuclease BN (tRNA processing enzyme)
MTRYWQTQLPSKNLRAVFLTHLHSDHTSGLPDLFATSWIFGRHQPLALYGPEGTDKLAEALLQYFAEDIRIRRDLTEMQPGVGATLRVKTVSDGVVYEDADVRVTAFAVDHRPVVPAFGYRFDLLAPADSSPASSSPAAPAAGPPPSKAGQPFRVDIDDSEDSGAFRSEAHAERRPRAKPRGAPEVSPSSPRRILYSIVISGDTRPSENLIEHAKGVDILVHEVYLPEHFDDVDSPEVAARLKAYHTSADEVGQVAAAAEVKLLVLTHVIPSDGEAAILERASKHFKGKIVVGRDLMRF